MQSMQRQWTRFIAETQKNQDIIGELSKLYIILHENVRKTIMKCTVNLQYDPSKDAEAHLTKIMDLLTRLNNSQDQYLRGVQSNIITKFQQQLIDLSQQVHKLLKSQKMAQNYDPKQLERIKYVNNKQKFSLKDQLKQSQQRILRSRSGHRKNKVNAQDKEVIDNSKELIEKFDVYKKEYLLKKQKLEKQIQSHIQKHNNQIIFSNKYSGSNLQEYFKLRKDLLDLVLVDQHTKKLNQPQQLQKKQQVSQNEVLDQKLFSEFKIKTKFMKNKVKENILNALAEVKMNLLEEYHLSNVKKLNEGNPDSLIALVPKKTKSFSQMPTRISNRSRDNTNKDSEIQRNQSLKIQYRPTATIRYPKAHKTYRPLVYQNGWTEQLETDYRKTLEGRLFMSKIPNPTSR